MATPPFYGANDLLGYDNVAVASFDQLSAPRAAKPRKDNDDTGNLVGYPRLFPIYLTRKCH